MRKKKSKFKHIDGGVCAPNDFMASGLACGVKKSKKKDIALVYTSFPASAAAVFTTNKVKAAPVIVSREVVKKGKAQAVVINSGNANACTGQRGMDDARTMARETSAALRIEEGQVLVASTGIIGVPMPIKKIRSGLWLASRMIKKDGGKDAAEAIMTTDLTRKEAAIEVKLGGRDKIRIGGMCKGSGMINPNMATMICVVTTDAGIDAKPLKKALDAAAADSFNMITVDNDMSTNDCVFVLANGRGAKIAGGKKLEAFTEGLKYICTCLAKEIARDGEGATKLFSVRVKNARTDKDARLAAKAVAGSSLFKCAIHGADPNFGRILAAAGYSGASFDPEKIDVYLNGSIQLVKDGMPVEFDAHKASEIMKEKEMAFDIDLRSGKSSAEAWGCDMTEGYITINAKYHT